MVTITGYDEDLTGEEMFERIENYDLGYEVNSFLALHYVGHEAGLSFQSVAACLLKDDELLVYERGDSLKQ